MSGKCPYITVEKVDDAGHIQPVLYCELKRKGGYYLEKNYVSWGRAIVYAIEREGTSTDYSKDGEVMVW